MPIYEYICGKCSKISEFILMPSEAQPKLCPHCGGKLQKLPSSPSFQFKGSGWYVTDYARRPSTGAAESKDPKGLKNSKEPKESKPPAEPKETAKPAPKDSASDTPAKGSTPPASKKES